VLEEGATICVRCKVFNQECIFLRIPGPEPIPFVAKQVDEALGSPPKAISVRGFPVYTRHIGVLKCHFCRRAKRMVGPSALCERLGGRLTNSYSVLPLNASGSKEDSSRNVMDASAGAGNADLPSIAFRLRSRGHKATDYTRRTNCRSKTSSVGAQVSEEKDSQPRSRRSYRLCLFPPERTLPLLDFEILLILLGHLV
jgi:hypothetical protein